MKLHASIMRILRVLVVAVAAGLLYRWLEPMGYGLHLVGVVLALAVAWFAWRAVRIRRARADDERLERWTTALLDPPARPAVIAELRAEIERHGPEPASRHARLRLVLAELLEADGEPRAAIDALEPIDGEALSDSFAGVVRHARAVACLSAGDADAAAAALDAVLRPTGDPSVDQRVHLLRGLIAVDRGDPEAALEIAEIAREEVKDDPELVVEVRVLRAVALDAQGDRAAALEAIAKLDDDMLEVLGRLGLPRVRELVGALAEERAR